MVSARLEYQVAILGDNAGPESGRRCQSQRVYTAWIKNNSLHAALVNINQASSPFTDD